MKESDRALIDAMKELDRKMTLAGSALCSDYWSTFALILVGLLCFVVGYLLCRWTLARP